MNNPIFRTLSQCLTGLPFVQIGNELFNVMAIEAALHLPAKESWRIILTGGAVMTLPDRDAARLVESFKDAPFAPYDSNSPDGPINSCSYFNVAHVQWFSLGEKGLTAHFRKDFSVFIRDVETLQITLESALTRARLLMANQGGKRR